MNFKNYFLISLPILGASLMAGDIYVDSSFDGIALVQRMLHIQPFRQQLMLLSKVIQFGFMAQILFHT